METAVAIETPAEKANVHFFQTVNEVITAHAGHVTASDAFDLVSQRDFEVDRLYVGCIVGPRDKNEALLFGRTHGEVEKAARKSTRRKKFTLVIAPTRRDLLLNRNYWRTRAPTFETLTAPRGVVVCKPITVTHG